MIKQRSIVCVTASFEKKGELFETLKKYSQHSDEQFAYWDEFAFTTLTLSECDAVLVLNTPSETIRVKCYPESTIAFMMEPGNKALHPWMFKGLTQYRKVYSPLQYAGNSIPSHGFLGWLFKKDYTYLKNLDVPDKTKKISCIASNVYQLKGHRQRLNFVNKLKQNFPQVDFFGKGSNFVPEKIDALLPYQYSIAIENTSSDDYFTEKINDCFLTYTVPIYFGCRNIRKYFPEQSFIEIDIENIKTAMQVIEKTISNDDWQERLPYLQEARNLVLNKYQPLAGSADVLRQIKTSEKKMIVLRAITPGFPAQIRKLLAKLPTIKH